jgi:hypothetical protein
MRVVVSGEGSPVSPETNIIYGGLEDMVDSFGMFLDACKIERL